MNREEAIKVLTILKANYQGFYKDISKKEAEEVISLYQIMFENCDYKLVTLAVKELINTFQHPPTVADIKNKMYELVNMRNDKSPTELWDKLLKAIRNGTYGYNEEFKKLPKEIQEFVREPFQLHELAGMDSNTIHSVVKGQFLKQIEIIKHRQKQESIMLPETKQLLFHENYKLLTEEDNVLKNV